jgi:aspartyl-tRNA(Asn)/glutamyl-tRNA(Gln) amidotransferase subunit A
VTVWASAAELAGRIRERQVSARELTRAHLDRIAAVDGKLGAFLLVDEPGALAQADAVDRAVARGEDPGPLAGVPVALKDLFCTRGLATTAGSKILEGWLPPYDGTVVERLRNAGAVLLGKLNMDEFAMGSSNENVAWKPCKNPWDLERVPGGSSGGSAVAVAAGLAAITLGTDTGGSIRQPASLSGVVGLRPTYGRVSRYGVVAFASSLDQVGPFGRTVEDVALALEVIAGHDPLDSTSIPAPVPRYRDALRDGVAGLRLGIPDEYFIQGMDPEVEAIIRAAIEELRRAGAEVKRISLPHTSYAVGCYYLVATAEAASNLARYDGVRYGLRASAPNLAEMYAETRGRGFGAEVKRRIMLGTYVLRSGYYDAYYKKAQKVRALIRRDFTEAFRDVDAVVTAASPTPAFKLGEKVADPLAMYLADIFTIPCNLAGLPGLVVPAGFTRAGLPVGLQILGPPLGEPTLLRVGGAYQRLTDWHTRHPA